MACYKPDFLILECLTSLNPSVPRLGLEWVLEGNMGHQSGKRGVRASPHPVTLVVKTKQQNSQNCMLVLKVVPASDHSTLEASSMTWSPNLQSQARA